MAPFPVKPDSKAIHYPEGAGKREVCTKTAAGRREYRKRVELMWERQDGLCALCVRPLRLEQATFDHERPRGHGGGFRDDRIEIDGQPINAAVHGLCNLDRGSKRTPYLIQPQVTSGMHLEEMLGDE
jgi:5-methylcytosine-specific restriction endonuclease McrA